MHPHRATVTAASVDDSLGGDDVPQWRYFRLHAPLGRRWPGELGDIERGRDGRRSVFPSLSPSPCFSPPCVQTGAVGCLVTARSVCRH